MQQDGFKPVHVRTDDGLMLYGRDYGDRSSSRLPVVCLAGLTRNSRDFHRIALTLADQGRRVVTLDYRGRGLSDRDPDGANYTIGREARDVIVAQRALDIDRAIFIGTSRGGLILHVLPALMAGLIAACVLNDVGPVIEPEGLRGIRDYLAKRTEPADFDEAARGLKAVHGADFPALADGDWTDMAHAIYRQTDGRIVADFDPALIAPLAAMDFEQPLPDLWPQFEALRGIPMLIVRGENSRLLSEQVAGEMVRRHEGGAELIMAHGQGHAPLLHVGSVKHALMAFIARH